MKIMTRNIGLCVHVKHTRHFRNLFSSQRLNHQFYTRHNDTIIKAVIQEHTPDTIVFQEIANREDFEHLRSLLSDYPHSYLYQSYHHTHNKVIFSKEKFHYHSTIVEKKELSYIKYDNGLVIIPIHLNAFSPTQRSQQIKRLTTLIDQQGRTTYCLAGDFNIWHVKNCFLSLQDKKSYTTLSSLYQDSGKDVGATTIIGAKFDKIFCSPSAHVISSKVIYKRGTYMDHYPLISNIDFFDK